VSDQVSAVRRKLVGSLNKKAIDHAVTAYGYDRDTLEEILVLCGGSAEEMSKRWNAFNRTPEQVMNDATKTQFELEQFLAYVRDELAKEKQQATNVRPRRKRRKRGRGR
jgi:phosphoglycolate phosphatase-like HAD superfamily hydrolase